jgi:hypothetical protein
MANSKVIGGPFDKKVLNQLNLRSDIFSKKEGRTDRNIEYLNSKTGWVKLTSSVNAGGSSALANKYVFIGGTKGRFGDKTYSNFSTGLGFRPMPGITGVQIRAINRFGVLKEATITFNCWDVAQLQELELLYMRPGFSALLEWGHSVYYKGADNFITTPSTVGSMFKEGTTKEAIYKEINKLKESSGYNYDGIFGFIKNFSWKYRQDGGYDCTTTLISIGEIIESLTIDVGTGTFPGNEEKEGKVASPTMIEQVFKTIIEKSTTDGVGNVYETLKTKHKNFIENYEKVNGISGIYIASNPVTITTPVDDKSATKSPNKFVYMRLDSFCALVNAILPCDKDKKSIIKMNTQMAKIGEDSDIPLCRFRTYDFHTSSDPGVCLIITPSTKKWSSGQLYPKIIEALRGSLGGTSSDEILNIWVNINVLGEAITTLVNTPDKGSRTLIKLFENILPKLNDVLGGDYNDLALHYEEDRFTYYIVDRKVKASQSEDDTPVLNITGLKSTVTNFDFTTKLSPALSTMVAVSAQNNGSDVGVEAEAMFRWNEGLTDRILGSKFINTTADTSKKAIVEAERKKQQSERYNKTFITLKEFYIGKKYDPEKFSAARVDYADFTKTYIQTYTERSAASSTKAGPAGIVPFEVGINMDGIAGIKIGQAFRINKGIMPAKYDEVLGFIVTGIEHTIGGNRWSTQLKAQTIVLKPGDRVATSPEYTTPSDGVNPNERQGFSSAPIKGSALLKTVLSNAGYKPGTFEYEFALVIGTKEGWLPKANGGKGSRSYRNNNPGNLDYSKALEVIDPGVTLPPGERFARFTTAELGVKALIERKIKRWSTGKMPVTSGNQDLIAKVEKWKKGTPPTISQFMYTYAPPNENNTEGYIGSVVASLQKTYPKVTKLTKPKDYLT